MYIGDKCHTSVVYLTLQNNNCNQHTDHDTFRFSVVKFTNKLTNYDITELRQSLAK